MNKQPTDFDPDFPDHADIERGIPWAPGGWLAAGTAVAFILLWFFK